MTRETELHRPDSQDGSVLVAGRYRLEALLGRGSMGTVHRARDVVLDRPVAVKVFPHDGTDPQHSVRYEQEARLLARLSHPGLVTVFDAGIDAAVADDAKPYLVMELVHGETLAARLVRGPLPPPDVAALASQLSTALAYIHRRDIVHRDIKPANILLAAADEAGEPGAAKLTDFGIARLVDGTRLTMTGFTLGTANYLSPEQLKGELVAAPSDVYALGLVLLECLTGEIAYPGHGVEAAVVRLHRPPVIPDSVPDGWTRLLRAMTDSDPSARPSAAEIGVAVTGLAAPPPSHAAAPAPTAAGPPPTPTRVLPASARPGPRRRPWLLAALAALALVVIIVVIALANSGGSAPTPPPPTYPSVPGQLGTDLHQLQQDVAR